jgi:antibiotic biosynthesis monooxygenase (ABM) superfamily enzyme
MRDLNIHTASPKGLDLLWLSLIRILINIFLLIYFVIRVTSLTFYWLRNKQITVLPLDRGFQCLICLCQSVVDVVS